MAVTDRAPDYAPHRTLRLSVEAIRQLRRRRTWIAFGFMLGLPWLLVAAFAVGGKPRSDQGFSVTATATAGGLNFAAFTLYVSAGFLLVVAVALFCGDTVAGEAGWSSLRYLLAIPVPRRRLLRQKMLVGFGYAVVNVLTLPAMALLAGTITYGWHDLAPPLGGAPLPAMLGLARLAVSVGYILVSLFVVAGLAIMLTVWTDSPLGAVGGAVGLVIVSNILDAVKALHQWRAVLPTHWTYSWLDAMQPVVQWRGMAQGAAISISYGIVLLALAFRHFRDKDILS